MATTPAAPTRKPRGAGGALRIHGTIARDLGQRIVSGAVAPGDLLDGELAASEALNVSRTAYREAVRILAAKGLVDTRPKAGTRVTPRERWHLLDPDVLSWLFGSEPDAGLLQRLFELRRVVEPEAAALAAERRTDAHVERMTDALARMAHHTLSVAEGRAADHDFHAALLAASDNPFLVSLTSSVGAAITWTTIHKYRSIPSPRDPVPDHRRVLDAVAAGDRAEAHQAMAGLVELAFDDTMRALATQGAAATA